MSPDANRVVRFTIVRESGTIREILTNSPEIDHFLRKVKTGQSIHTWINYAHDLKTFFSVIDKLPEAVDRRDCVVFMEQQDKAGLSSQTINRRLAALSSLFTELHLLDPARFPQNPVSPSQRGRRARKRSQSLYRRQPDRIPDIIPEKDLQTFFNALPTWRDRTLMLLLWVSCLRIGEAVAIRFEDIECSHKSISIARGKGGVARIVFMEELTFSALNKYLDEERKNLFPEVDAVFVAFKGRARGHPLTENAFQHTIDYYAQKCGIPYLHAHLFRHTGITQLIQKGMSEPAVRGLVGHTHPASLDPYLHLTDHFVESEFEKTQEALSPARWLSTPSEGGQS